MHTDLRLDLNLVRSEWAPAAVKGLYLNSGSCGVKPISVIAALTDGYQKLNENPTIATFIDDEIWQRTRDSAAELFGVPSQNLMLTQNSTYGIQLVMQSLLLNSGDEFVCTTDEHGSVNTLSKYLAETRGIVVRQHRVDPYQGSDMLCRGILDLVSAKTKLVLVSEINCLTGWRPRLPALVDALASACVPLLVDGAHAPGHGPIHISDFPFWVGSGHKWMGAPNGCGFLYAHESYKEFLRPLLVGDRLFNESFSPAHRLEWPGTCDVVRLRGLEAAIELQKKLGPNKIAARHYELHAYLRESMARHVAPGKVRTPWIEGETSALYSIYWEEKQLCVKDLREELWHKYGIWTQPDFASANPGEGLRISCNVFNTEEEIDALVSALGNLVG